MNRTPLPKSDHAVKLEAPAGSAGFQRTVSPTSSRQTVESSREMRIGNPGYSRLETCAAGFPGGILQALVMGVWMAFAGCAVGPNYKEPKPDVPESFRGPAIPAATNSVADLPWWELFHDEHLQALIRTAFTNNYDLRIAIARVEQAHAVLAQNRGLFLPQLGYDAAISRGRNAVGTTPTFNGGKLNDAFSVVGTASWEIDVWGRIRRLNEAARAQYLASQEARRDVMVTLLSDVATAYFQLLSADNAMEIAKRSTNSFGESLRIFSERLQGGIVSKLETSAAEAALASAAATVPDLERQIAILENRLNILTGQNPGSVPRRQVNIEKELNQEVPPGLPSELLRRRPDIRQAEEALHAANAQVGVAVADFFPRLSLTGLFGQTSPELAAFTSGSSLAYSLGTGLAGPLFQGGALRGRLEQARGARREAFFRYQSTVLSALQEVSNALISRQKYAEARVQQARAVNAYRVAVEVATERYIAGRAGYFEVLQEQQQLLPAENNLNQVELNHVLSTVQLYRALGGGWATEEKSATEKSR